MTFDPATYGLMSHYPPNVQQRIRRIVLEDSPTGVPEEWLSKLSHQTMAKMLTSASTPRHTFWACLHLYINRKYGSELVTGQRQSAADTFGQALQKFGTIAPLSVVGDIERSETDCLTITQDEDCSYTHISQTINVPSRSEDGMHIQHKYEGIGFKAASKGDTSQNTFILRDCLTHDVSVQHLTDAQLQAGKS